MKYSRTNIFVRLNKSIHIKKRYMFYNAILTFIITGVSLVSPFLYKILVDDVMKGGKLLNGSVGSFHLWWQFILFRWCSRE